jgi:hypothetical protein
VITITSEFGLIFQDSLAPGMNLMRITLRRPITNDPHRTSAQIDMGRKSVVTIDPAPTPAIANRDARERETASPALRGMRTPSPV